MPSQNWTRLSRRDALKLMGVGGAVVAAGLPAQVWAQARKDTLVIAIDISDTITLDPARLAQYTLADVGRSRLRHAGDDDARATMST